MLNHCKAGQLSNRCAIHPTALALEEVGAAGWGVVPWVLTFATHFLEKTIFFS